MKGLDLAAGFFREFGKPMLNEQFSDVLPYLAVGLVGSGSECYGYDDDISKDHDFEAGFCIFLPSEDIVDRQTAFRLERAYSKLPSEYLGVKRSPLSPVGGNRHGVIRTADFFYAKTGSPDGELTLSEWFSIPEYSLLEATNGAVFLDNFGEFSKIRERLSYFPEDIRLKKLAGNLLLLGQSGQYNFNRCVFRGDTAAAQLSVFEFFKSALSVLFLLKKQYMPYYKWSFRALRELYKDNGELINQLEFLISNDNAEQTAKLKSDIIEKICSQISAMLRNQALTPSNTSEMEQQAYIVNDNIRDNNIRNAHILAAV